MVSILRLGHRPERDKRMTTHVGLTARAFGVERMYLPKLDSRVEKTLNDVSKRFGGSFQVKETNNWKGLMESWEGDIIHLTMYGEKIDDFFKTAKLNNPLIVVGAEKVPGEVYKMSDYNIAVGNQPHSEVAALAVFLDRFNKRQVPREFMDSKIAVLPSNGMKRVVDYSNIPTLQESYKLCIGRGMDQELMEHTISVLERALDIQNRFGGDLRLIMTGAILHDIGRTETHGANHGATGGDIIRKQGWDEELAKIVERHVGGGITKEEAVEQGLPKRDMVPSSLEEKIVCHADNTAGGAERFQGLLERTKSAGHLKSAERMKDLADHFKDKKEKGI
ncbi:MAG: tRNA (cytidine(56)-2'-O)-methyltransferase [Thermoplasmata archaeon]